MARGSGGTPTAVAMALNATRLQQGIRRRDARNAVQDHVYNCGDQHKQRKKEEDGVAPFSSGRHKQQTAETAGTKLVRLVLWTAESELARIAGKNAPFARTTGKTNPCP